MSYKDYQKQKEFQRDYYQNVIKPRRQKWLEENGPCVDCGSTENLEVDHIDPSTKVSHRIWTWSENRRIQELTKCVVRCNACHLRKTIINGSGEFHPNSKFSNEQAQFIRDLNALNIFTHQQLANLYSVSLGAIRKIIYNERYKGL